MIDMPQQTLGTAMVETWLADSMAHYNKRSLESKDAYAGLIQISGESLDLLILWALQSLPDEVLVGFDPDPARPHRIEVDQLFSGSGQKTGLFAGEGFVIGEPNLVNRGDSYSVHHIPEEWTDDFFAVDRGPRGGRFTHWLHTHPNAVAIPSGADADAAQFTDGVDMILGIEFTPEGPLPWFDDVEGVRRPLGNEWEGDERPMLGIAPTGHLIHGLELVAYHRSGQGINVVFVDQDGLPYGWENIRLR